MLFRTFQLLVQYIVIFRGNLGWGNITFLIFTNCYSSIKPWWSFPSPHWEWELSQPHNQLALPNLWCVSCVCVWGERACGRWWNQARWDPLSPDIEFGIHTAFLSWFCSMNGTLSAVCSCWPSAYPILSSSLTQGLTTSSLRSTAQTPSLSSQTNQLKKVIYGRSTFLAAFEKFLICQFDSMACGSSGSQGCFSNMRRFKKRAESRNIEPQEQKPKWQPEGMRRGGLF